MSNKNTGYEIYAPVTDRVIPITEVKDDIFSQKIFGDGVAIVRT